MNAERNNSNNRRRPSARNAQRPNVRRTIRRHENAAEEHERESRNRRTGARQAQRQARAQNRAEAAPAAAEARPSPEAVAAQIQRRRIQEERTRPWYVRAWNNLWKYKASYTRAALKIIDTIVFKTINWTTAAVAITTPLVTLGACTTYEWIVKADGSFRKILVSALNGIHDTNDRIKPAVDWLANPAHMWTTVGIIVGYIAANTLVKTIRKTTDNWPTKDKIDADERRETEAAASGENA